MINPNRFSWPAAPIGLEYACNSLLREDIEFDLIDFNFKPENLVYQKLRADNIDLVGMTVRNIDSGFLAKVEFFQPSIKKLVERIKNTKDCKVVLGGVGFSVVPKEIMEYTGADFGVVGYGEEALPKLVRALRQGGDLSQIDNLAWRKNGNIQVNPVTTGDYENIPVRRRNIVRNRSYYGMYSLGNIETMRGCLNRCGFCCMPDVVGPKIVTRKAAHIVEELKELKSMGMQHVFFTDTEFNMASRKYTFELCKQIIDSKVGITWTTNIHPDPKMVSMELLDIMKQAGCTEVFLSVESGNEEIVADMEKKHTVEDGIICTELVRKANISRVQTYLIGWPGESTETIDQTIDHVKLTQPEQPVLYCGVRINPNTKLARIAMDEGYIPEDTNFLYPIFYHPERVLKEFLPYMRRRTKDIPNCYLPTRFINFLNRVMLNVYMKDDVPGGLGDKFEYLRNLSGPKKFKFFGETLLDYALPFRRRYIPLADSDR
jgi:radical SAM superfamily enzyme YgiQ (UPF0313 family)